MNVNCCCNFLCKAHVSRHPSQSFRTGSQKLLHADDGHSTAGQQTLQVRTMISVRLESKNMI